MKVLLRSIFISTIIFSITEKVFSTLVETPSGSINGTIIYFKDIPVKTFLGIPYAEKPVGSLRFQKPRPVKPWNTTLQATEFPPQCVQFSTSPFPFYYNLTEMSEDCLYLNIWVPEIRDGHCKKSVMFWIHGGGFRISSTLIDFYHGQALAAEGDVVVVTTNYRLGVEGFLFSDTEDAPGNMGLWDIVEALKWVRNNIQYFGGDPDSITLFGQSAGGIAIGMLCTSPVARDGLFKRIIMQSGSPASSAGDDNDRSFRISQQVAAFVGCAESDDDLKRDPEAVVQCLRGKNALELAKALSNVTAGSPRSYYPRYGDDLLPKNPREAIINGEFEPFDVLIGSNDGDGADLITSSMRDVFGFFGEKDPEINKTFGSSIIRDKFNSFPEPNAVVEQYLGGIEEDNYDEIRLRNTRIWCLATVFQAKSKIPSNRQ